MGLSLYTRPFSRFKGGRLRRHLSGKSARTLSCCDMQKKKLSMTMNKGFSLKKKYLEAVGASTSIIARITTDEAWAWANNDKVLKPLKEATDKISLAQLSDFSQTLLTTADQASLKRDYSSERIIVEMEVFLKIESDVDLISKAVKRLSKMQSAHTEE